LPHANRAPQPGCGSSARRRDTQHAQAETDPDGRQQLLSFIIIGAGPTGVELAGAIASLPKTELAMPYRSIHGRRARILLIEAGERDELATGVCWTHGHGAGLITRSPRLTRHANACQRTDVSLLWSYRPSVLISLDGAS